MGRGPSEGEARRFWAELESFGDAIALIDERADKRLTYRQLAREVAQVADGLRADHKALAFLGIESNAQSVICYLALLCAGHAVLLSSGPGGGRLVERYRPEIVLTRCAHQLANYRPGDPVLGQQTLFYEIDDRQPVADELCLLMPTSGSMAAAKLAALSYHNVSSAADQVRQALDVGPADRAITCLPLDHVYGLSVLHSQLAAGGSVVLNVSSVIDRVFWERFDRNEVTVLAGVPWTFNVMKDCGIDFVAIPSIRKLTQSGARLDSSTLTWLLEAFPSASTDLYLMYGQTEATGRIAVLPPSEIQLKPGSVGRPVQFGSFSCSDDGEIIYRGPNVMLGYADDRNDLALGDRMHGTLPTGDLGQIDADGALYLTGRKSRFCKILGNRINLDEVQSLFAGCGPVAAVSDDESLTICFEKGRSSEVARQIGDVARELRLPRQSISVKPLVTLPRTPAGKIAYEKLLVAGV